MWISDKEVKELNGKIEAIEYNMGSLSKSYLALQNDYDKLKEDYGYRGDQIAALDRAIYGLESWITQQNADYENLYEKVSELKRLAINDDAGNWNEMRAILDKICDI